MSVRKIIQTFDEWRARGEPIALATVYQTLGSTYSKPGQRILIAANGDYQGLVSGGCLEGDLAERARSVISAGRPAPVTYDLRDEADAVWGLGVGCNGLIRVFLQPLLAERQYEPFAAIVRCLVGRERAGVATVIESDAKSLSPGTTLIARGDAVEAAAELPRAESERLAGRARRAAVTGVTELVAEPGLSVLYACLKPIPKLLILGAGLDAMPLVGVASELGWFVTVADHRPAYLQRGGFQRAERALLVVPGRVADALPLGEFDAVIVMSHHLETDKKYLAELKDFALPYLGVLGPRARRDRLLESLCDEAPDLAARLRGPVGLDIGADSPESIALSIVAELQTTFARGPG
jgi:xanthine/CO dehydrogenase XdhC/CoxF family maturation factor